MVTLSVPVHLPPSVARILESHVDSFDKLEIAVALARTPGQAVECRVLSQQLGVSADDLAACIQELVHSGLLVAHGGTVGPAGPDAVRALDQLLEAYQEDSISVMHALSEIAVARIRGMAARAFASAFDLRPTKKKEGRDG